MPTYEVTSPDGRVFSVTAPDGATQEQVLEYARANFTVDAEKQRVAALKPPQNADKVAGANAPGAVRGALSVLNGPTLGFGDEISGAIGAVIDKAKGKPGEFSDLYRQNRDFVRGAQEYEQKQNPIFTAVTQGAASAPLGMLGRTAQVSGVLPSTIQAMKTGGIYGAVSGIGNSQDTDAAGLAVDALKGGSMGAVTAGVLTPTISAIGSAGRNAMNRLSETSAAAFAREKVAEALARDARGNVFASNASSPVGQVAARLNKLGPDAAIVDAAGRNTNQLLDTLATLPGRTKDSVYNLQRQRTATAADRLRVAADNALGSGGQRLADTLEALDAARSKAAAPLYEKVRAITVNADDDLASIVKAADKLGALGEAKKIATASRESFTLDPATPGAWSMRDLDHVKRGIDALVEANTMPNGKVNAVGRAVDKLRRDLLEKLDDLTTNTQTGQSLYRQARDAYAGPSALMDAATKGREAITRDESAIVGMVRGMSDSEREAFRVGAFEGLRAKLGTQSGQTNILNMWKEPATREKLKVIFGDERAFREFAASVGRESVMKRIQNVGTGSQTASRQAGMGDIDVSALTDAASALTNAKSGNVLGVLGAAQNAWGRVATPQNVRDEMGRILMQRGPQAAQTVNEMGGLLAQINRNNGILSDSLGISGGVIGSSIAPAIPIGLLGR